MQCEYIAKGKTIDEAVENGLEELALERDDVSVEVLETPERGFLGIGSTPAVVKLTYEGTAPVIPETEEKPAKTKPEKPAKPEKIKAAKPEKPVAEKAKPAKQEKSKQKKEEKSASADNGFVRAADSVAFAKDIIRLMGYSDLTVESAATEEGISITVDGENAGALIGRRGETLNALQYLISLFENRGNDEFSRISFDVLGYREKRKVTLEKLAHRMAVTAVKTHRNIYLDPMPNYERKIIHACLQEFEGVSTYSTGSEPNRKVVIVCGGKKDFEAPSGEHRNNGRGGRPQNGDRRRQTSAPAAGGNAVSESNGGYSNSGFTAKPDGENK